MNHQAGERDTYRGLTGTIVIRSVVLAVLFARGLADAATVEPSEKPAVDIPIIRWTIPFPDFKKEAAGYPALQSAESMILFQASEEDGVYNHSPIMAFDSGRFYIAWTNHKIGEDGPGERVLITSSPDWRTFPPPTECFLPIGETRPTDELGWVVSGVGFLRVAGRLLAVGEVRETIGFSDASGENISPKRTTSTPLKRSKSRGRLVREVYAGGLGTVLSLGTIEGDWPGEGKPSAVEEHLAKSITQEISSPPPPTPPITFMVAPGTLRGRDGHNLCEPTYYVRTDGVMVRLYRDLDLSHRLYVSQAANGADWSQPVPTLIPDSPSLTRALTLQDKRVVLIGNFVSEPFDRAMHEHYPRDPLVLAVSNDGTTFDRAFALRSKAPALKYPGPGRSGPGFAYPDAVEHDGAIYIVYSIGKEHIGLSRVPLRELAPPN